MDPKASKWLQMIPNVYRWLQWLQMAGEGAKIIAVVRLNSAISASLPR